MGTQKCVASKIQRPTKGPRQRSRSNSVLPGRGAAKPTLLQARIVKGASTSLLLSRSKSSTVKMRRVHNSERLLCSHQADARCSPQTACKPASIQSKTIEARYRSCPAPSSRRKARESTAVGVLRTAIRRESHGLGRLVDHHASGSDEIHQLKQGARVPRNRPASGPLGGLVAPGCG